MVFEYRAVKPRQKQGQQDTSSSNPLSAKHAEKTSLKVSSTADFSWLHDLGSDGSFSIPRLHHLCNVNVQGSEMPTKPAKLANLTNCWTKQMFGLELSPKNEKKVRKNLKIDLFIARFPYFPSSHWCSCCQRPFLKLNPVQRPTLVWFFLIGCPSTTISLLSNPSQRELQC